MRIRSMVTFPGRRSYRRDTSNHEVHLQFRRFVVGDNAHWLGHEFLRCGEPEEASACFRAAMYLDVSAAEHDLAALAADGGGEVEHCPAVAVDWPGPQHTVRLRSRHGNRRVTWRSWRMSTTVVAVACAIVALLATVAVRPVVPTATPDVSTRLPTERESRPTGKLYAYAFPSRQPTGDVSRSTAPIPPPDRPVATGVNRTQPSLGARLPAGSPTGGRYLMMSRTDGDGRQFTVLVALAERSGMRKIRFRSEAGLFRATLQADGDRACSWRFRGQDWAGRTTPDVARATVQPGQRHPLELTVRDWPLFTVEVRGGSSPESCLLIDHRFVPVPDPVATPTAPAQPSEGATVPSATPPTRMPPDPASPPSPTAPPPSRPPMVPPLEHLPKPSPSPPWQAWTD